MESNIVFDGNTYRAFRLKLMGSSTRTPERCLEPTLTISNLDSNMTALLLVVNATTAGNDLGGAEVRRIRTLAKYQNENFVTKNAVTQGNDSLN